MIVQSTPPPQDLHIHIAISNFEIQIAGAKKIVKLNFENGNCRVLFCERTSKFEISFWKTVSGEHFAN